MTKSEEARACRLEELLKTSSGSERREVFSELCDLYAAEMHSNAIKWARARHLPEPVNDGLAAFSDAIILLTKSLDKLDFNQKSLRYQLKGKIWSELGHGKTQGNKYRNRNRPMAEDFEHPPDPRIRTEARVEASAELRRYANTPSRKKILRGAQLQLEGYSWEEAAREVGWDGTAESLRTSFSRLKKNLGGSSGD